MKKGTIEMVAMLMLGAQVATAQTPASPSAGGAAKPQIYRYGSISGSWLLPSGEFDKIAGDGWAITLEGFQFLSPT
jgi:hypothetical protein